MVNEVIGAEQVQSTCKSCNALLLQDDAFCSECGAVVVATPPAYAPPIVDVTVDPAWKKGRRWLLAIAILVCIGGVALYFITSEEVEKQIAAAETATAGMDPVERDEMAKANTGMTFAEAMAHDRGNVRILLVVNLVLSAFYFGLWWYAKRNLLLAAVLALGLYVTSIAVSGVFDPKSLSQGIVLKIIFVVGLSQTIKMGLDARKLNPT